MPVKIFVKNPTVRENVPNVLGGAGGYFFDSPSKLEGHSVERMYLRQGYFEGWLIETILEPRQYVYAVYWKMGRNPKIGQVWCPVAPQLYVVPKSWADRGTPWPLDNKVE